MTLLSNLGREFLVKERIFWFHSPVVTVCRPGWWM